MEKQGKGNLSWMSKLFVKKLEINGLCWARIWIIGVGKVGESGNAGFSLLG